MMDRMAKCPNCDGTRLYQNVKGISAGSGGEGDFLKGLGTFWSPAEFTIVVCEDCGMTRFFASKDAREQLRESKKWRHL